MSVPADALNLRTLDHFLAWPGNPNLGIFEPAVTGGIDGKFARPVFVAEHAGLRLSELISLDRDASRPPRRRRTCAVCRQGAEGTDHAADHASVVSNPPGHTSVFGASKRGANLVLRAGRPALSAYDASNQASSGVQG
jgi:hypothetical protein